jgi:hypothetical protein
LGHVFWFYDDFAPLQYMMYTAQPSGADTYFATDFGPGYVHFYSETFPAASTIEAGTTTVYINAYTPSLNSGSIVWRLFAGNSGAWTELGAATMPVPFFTGDLLQISFDTNSYVFDTGEQLMLEAYVGQYLEISWDGWNNSSRLVIP